MLSIKSKEHLRKTTRKLIAAASALLFSAVFAVNANASEAGIVATSTGNLNVRSSPSVYSAIVDSLPKGSYVTLERKSDGWWYAEYDNGRYGYLSAQYVKQLKSSVGSVDVSGDHLNVRSGPSASYSAIDALVDGAEVIIIGDASSNGWGLVLYDGDTYGYVNLSYISQKNETSSYKPIQLNVVNFKQYDSRWGDMYVGASGNTVRNIGCTLTCVAMAESYRKGYNITPSQVVSTSKFTSGGALYWPGHYVKDYSSDYLGAIYRRLSEGKPVIFHSSNKYGSSHWVLVTGFTGGDTLTADKFIINDPGSSTRTTLSEHLKHYPNYSKTVYYY